MSEPIIITQENIGSVLFQDVKFTVKKYSSLKGVKDEKAVKYNYTYQIVWNGAMAETMLEQASAHQATNEYNNTRPSNDLEIMSASECLRRTDAMIKLADSGLPRIVEAIAERAKVKKISNTELVDKVQDKKLPKKEHDYYQALYDARLAKINAELVEMTEAIK